MPVNSKTLMALLLGAASGAVLGILFAPESGKNTRQKIRKWKEEMEDELSSLYEEGKEKVNNLKSKAKQRVQDEANSPGNVTNN